MRLSILPSLLFSLLFVQPLQAADLEVGNPAPLFRAQTHLGESFDLRARKGKWTVLYFYPKAGTPGCTKQACAFRDHMKQIRALNADVFGISADSVKDQAAFHKEQNLSFTLLADSDHKIIGLYGSKMPLLNMSKRWTFILDPELKIRDINKDVNPEKDAALVADKIAELQAQDKRSRK